MAKIGRNKEKCKQYRAKVGKPRGKSALGNKSGQGFIPRKMGK